MPYFSSISALSGILELSKSPGCVFYTIGGNDLSHTKPEKVTTDILSYAQYLTDGVGIWNLVIWQILRRQPWALRASYNADVVNVKRQLKAEAEKGMEFISGHVVVFGRT